MLHAEAQGLAAPDLEPTFEDEPDGGMMGGEGLERRTHRRGLAPYVFVPWDRVSDHVMNLPVHQMDFYVPG